MNRKFRKLLRDPKLFFRDMYNKRSIQIKKYLLVKYNGTQQYTVVSAVYNVEKYLNDYFSSLTKQSLNFKKHIQLILVDDGSTDRSAEIIKQSADTYLWGQAQSGGQGKIVTTYTKELPVRY